MHDALLEIDLRLLGLDPAPLSQFDGTKENKRVNQLAGSEVLYALMIRIVEEEVRFLSHPRVYVENLI